MEPNNSCNLNYKFTFPVPVMIHNFRGYDSHLIFFATAEFPQKEAACYRLGILKIFNSFFPSYIVFKNSYQYFACSLEQLANNLLKAGGSTKFPLLFNEFSMYSDAQSQLILRNGVYSYEFIDILESWMRRWFHKSR